jgi:hypothetical protein
VLQKAGTSLLRRRRMTVWLICRRDARTAIAVLCAALALFAGAAAAQPPARSDAMVARGETDPTSAGATAQKSLADIPVWKRITLGTYKGVNAVREALDAARMRVGESADEILGRPAFPYSRTKSELDLVVLTAADLGFPTGSTPVAEIYRRALQFGLELCPAEVGPQLRLQYANQPLGEFLHIAMQPIATWRGELVDLTVANGGAGLLLLGGDGSPDLTLHSSVKFVFVRPARIAMPNLP